MGAAMDLPVLQLEENKQKGKEMEVSYSPSLITAWDCPRRGFLTLKDKLQEKKPVPAPPVLIGNYVHQKIAQFLAAEAETTKKKTRRASQEIAEPMPWIPLELQTEADQIFKNFLDFYKTDPILQQNKWRLKTDIEIKLKAKIRKFKMSGIPDYLTPHSNFILIRDWKTDHAVPSDEAIRQKLQLPFYAVLYNYRNKKCTQFLLEYIYLRHNIVKRFYLNAPELAEWKERIFDRIFEIEKILSSGFVYSEPEPLASTANCYYCDYILTCPIVRPATHDIFKDPVKMAMQLKTLEQITSAFKRKLKTIVEQTGNIKLPDGSELGFFPLSRRVFRDVGAAVDILLNHECI